MRTLNAVVLSMTLVTSGAFAAGTNLPAGKPAGVKQAAALGPNFALILLGMGVVIGGITLAVSNSGCDGVTTPTTTATGTVP